MGTLRTLLLAGTSALALTAGPAGATMFRYTGTVQTFTVPTAGEWAFDVTGAGGGGGFNGGGGGSGGSRGGGGGSFLATGFTGTFNSGGNYSDGLVSIYPVLSLPAPVPEPSGLALLGTGLLGLIALGNRCARRC